MFVTEMVVPFVLIAIILPQAVAYGGGASQSHEHVSRATNGQDSTQCSGTGVQNRSSKSRQKKSIWGPTSVEGQSQFPTYGDLGVGIYQMKIGWHDVAPTQPEHPTDPSDPAYRWPSDVDYAIQEAGKYCIRISMMLIGAPGWANGGRDWQWAPKDPRDFAQFATAAARRYPAVPYWMIWGEPMKHFNFMPLATQPASRLGERPTRKEARGPRLYARILDAAYVALKRANRHNVVIGGNSVTGGDLPPLTFIRALRLPNGKPPRMDLYGHNPFTARKPNLAKPPLVRGVADFSDLDTLARWVDRYLTRPGSKQRKIRLFLSEFFVPTDKLGHELGFYVSRKTQAKWLAAALRITRRWSRIYTLGWLSLYDDPPNGYGNEVRRGLIDQKGQKKPAYYTYKRG